MNMNRLTITFVTVLMSLMNTAEAAKAAAKVAQKAVASEALGKKILDASFAPFYSLIASHQNEVVCIPCAILSVIGGIFMIWLISRLLDSKPYLFNDGKLGYLEKTSIFVKKGGKN